MQGIIKFFNDLISQASSLDPVSLVDFLLKILIYPLTLFNTYAIFREKLKKPKLDLDVEYSAFYRRGIFLDFKIDIVLTARNEDIYLREIFIFNGPKFGVINKFNQLWFKSFTYYPYDGPVCNGVTWSLGFQPPVNKISIEKAVRNSKCKHSGDIADQNTEFFGNFKEDLWSSLRTEDWEQGIVGLKMAKNSVMPLTLVGELEIADYESDEAYRSSSRKIPKLGWHLCCDYGINKHIKNLTLRTRNL